MPHEPQPRATEQGFSVVEICMAVVLVVLGLLGLISSVVGAQVLGRDNQERNLANAAAMTAIELFRENCRADFTAAITAHQTAVNMTTAVGVVPPHGMVTAIVRRNEPGQQPPIDLNGDGDTLDNNVAAAACRFAVLEVTVQWRGARGNQSFTTKAIFARGDV